MYVLRFTVPETQYWVSSSNEWKEKKKRWNVKFTQKSLFWKKDIWLCWIHKVNNMNHTNNELLFFSMKETSSSLSLSIVVNINSVIQAEAQKELVHHITSVL